MYLPDAGILLRLLELSALPVSSRESSVFLRDGPAFLAVPRCSKNRRKCLRYSAFACIRVYTDIYRDIGHILGKGDLSPCREPYATASWIVARPALASRSRASPTSG